MKVIETYRDYLIKNSKLEKVSSLRKTCYFVFSQYCSLDEMEEIISNDWKELIHLLSISNGYSNIVSNFLNLKNGFFNRREFADSIKYFRENVDSEISKLESNTQKTFEDFSKEYNDYFAEGEKNSKECGSKLIYHILIQPEVKEIIMDFLKQ